MRVAPEIIKHLAWPAKRGFGIDHPLLAAESLPQPQEGARLSELRQQALKGKLDLVVSTLELFAKEAREHFHREKEGLPTGHPALAIEGETAAGALPAKTFSSQSKPFHLSSAPSFVMNKKDGTVSSSERPRLAQSLGGPFPAGRLRPASLLVPRP